MYEYKFETIKINAFTLKMDRNYEEVIQDYAAKGWRLHTFTTLPFNAGGQATGIQLIFEKQLS
jgi:hypothetical protein